MASVVWASRRGAAAQPVEHRLRRLSRPQALGGPAVERLAVAHSILVEGDQVRTGRLAVQDVRARLQDLAGRPAQGSLLGNGPWVLARAGDAAGELVRPVELDDQVDQGAVPSGGAGGAQRRLVVGPAGRLDLRARLVLGGGRRLPVGHVGQQRGQRPAGVPRTLAHLRARVPRPQKHAGGQRDAAGQRPARDPSPGLAGWGGDGHGNHEREQHRGLRGDHIATEHAQDLHDEHRQHGADHRRPGSRRRECPQQDQPSTHRGGAGVGTRPRDRRPTEVSQAQQREGAEHGERGRSGIPDDGPGEGGHERHHDGHTQRPPQRRPAWVPAAERAQPSPPGAGRTGPAQSKAHPRRHRPLPAQLTVI